MSNVEVAKACWGVAWSTDGPQLLREMDGVFDQLQGTPVDPVMVGGELGKTLFDFIDAETVESLQQDALEQSKECVATSCSP